MTPPEQRRSCHFKGLQKIWPLVMTSWLKNLAPIYYCTLQKDNYNNKLVQVSGCDLLLVNIFRDI